MTRISSLSERPEHHGPRRLVHWINPAGERKVHSLVDKVYKRKNLEVAWEKVKRNRGAGGVMERIWLRSRHRSMQISIDCTGNCGTESMCRNRFSNA